MLKAQINCTIIGLESVMPEDHGLGPCQNYDDAFKTYTDFSVIFELLNAHATVPVPCQQSGFDYSIKYLHQNSWITDESSSLQIEASSVSVMYDTMLTKEQVETKVYDIENLMTSVGGNLGLFLGFSTLLHLLKFLYSKMAF
jgi:hypothetical protein